MKKIIFGAGILLLFSSAAFTQELKLEEILERYYKASGLDKMQQINTVIMTGTIIQQDAMPVKIIKMRPDKYLMEYDVADITSYQGYDGKTAWMTTPWTGNPKPQQMPEERAKDMRSKADFDGQLYNWKAKGHAATLEGTDSIGKEIAYKIKLTRADGSVENYFIDTNNFLLKKRLSYRMNRGQQVVMENYFSDFREVQGIPFAFTQQNFMGGQSYSSIQFETIVLNQPVKEKKFTMPQ